MRKLFMLSVVLFCLSCSSDSEIEQDLQLNDIANFEGVIKSIENDLSISSGEFVRFESHELLEIDSNMYLRSRNGDKITTTLLAVTSDGLQTRGISCTTSGCSGNNGCIPKADGKSCTSCLFGDCTKTVTSGGIGNHQ